MSKLPISVRILLLLILNVLAIESYSQDSEIQTAIEKKQYSFQAQSLTAMKGGTRQLSPGYALSIKGDTLICNLPYIGRVYQPSIGSTDGGFNFTSTRFEYQTKVRKKGGWDISIKTKDLPNQRQFNLTIYQNGNVSLRVTCNDRESIGYNGSLNLDKIEK